jgi:hypothetical protein
VIPAKRCCNEQGLEVVRSVQINQAQGNNPPAVSIRSSSLDRHNGKTPENPQWRKIGAFDILIEQ